MKAVPAVKSPNAAKLAALRIAMAAEKIDGFLVPRESRYTGEFVAPQAEALAWLTGFTGSAGLAAVLKESAAIFTDSRYTIQLARQADPALYQLHDLFKMPPSRWIAERMKPGQVLGYDPWLHTVKQAADLREALAAHDIFLKPAGQAMLGMEAAKSSPENAAFLFPENIAGKPAAEKREDIRAALARAGACACIIAVPDSIAWLLNMRGADMEHTPVVLAHAFAYENSAAIDLIVEPGKIPSAVLSALKNVTLTPPDQVETLLPKLREAAEKAKKPVALDFTRCPDWYRLALDKEGVKILNLKDPCIAPKSIKTPAEQDAIRCAHVNDGAAICKFLAWFDQAVTEETLSELDVVDRLEAFRREDPAYRGPSFATIAGFNANGAVVHYRATPETNLKIAAPGLLLIDSGGQYEWGTTDITRTVVVGAPSTDMIHHFTAVLKGHIALAMARFPPGTSGAQLDALARAPLWKAGLDYGHGTGHGVGCYLSVHEEAASLSPRGMEPVRPGMLLSNEPGYYREGAYGIRLENLVLMIPQADDSGMLGFETVTFAPFDRRLIHQDLLEKNERAWIDAYHAAVFEKISAAITGPSRDRTLAWLRAATAKLDQV